MKQIRKQIAGLTAVLLLAGCITERMPVLTKTAADAASPLLRFAAQAEAVAAKQTDAFSVLQYDPETQNITLDGQSSGREAGGFRIVDGALMLDAEAAGLTDSAEPYLSLDDAKDAVGCEVYESDGKLLVSSPFQSGTLIVAADGAINAQGASAECSGYGGIHVVQYRSAAEAYQAYLAFSQQENVQFAEPNRRFHTTENIGFNGNWGYEAIGADDFQAFYMPENAADVTVAVIDTGIYAQHSLFHDRIAEGGTSFVSVNEGSTNDGEGHGTHCAGIICNQTGENVKILPLKALDDWGGGDTIGIYCAMMYAAEQKVDIVSMSLGGIGKSPLLESAAAALEAAGIPCVVAAGNDAIDAQYFSPACIDSVITVSCTDQFDEGKYTLASFSNYGAGIDFAAPGCDISSAGILFSDAEDIKSGTSMAAPMVAACYANLLSVDPSLTPAQIYDYLRTNTIDLGAYGFDTDYGWGMVKMRDFAFTDGQCKEPSANPRSGVYDAPFEVSLATKTAGAEIYYTTDNTIPTRENGTLYDGTPFRIAGRTDLRAIAYKDDSGSSMLHEVYQFETEPPIAEPAGGIYDAAADVTLSAGHDAIIYYTTDGSSPVSSPTAKLYQGEKIHIAETAVIRAAADLGGLFSTEMLESYVIAGKGAEKLIQVEDGVLTSYVGSFETLDLAKLLPDTVISEIADNAFAQNKYLKTVILPDTVTKIGDRAFYDCPDLNAVTGKGVESVGSEAFYLCGALSETAFPKLTVIGAEAFRNCEKLTEPAWDWTALTEIDENSFRNAGITGTLDLKSLKKIGAGAFSMTGLIARVDLPDSLTVIPEKLFCCSEVRRVRAMGVTAVGAEAFRREQHQGTCILELPFGKIKTVGALAFANLRFENAAQTNLSFDALETVSGAPFYMMECNVLSLAAVKHIPAKGLEMLAAAMVYLESVETMDENAVTIGGYGTTGLVFGGKVKAFTGEEIELPERASVIAAAEDSPVSAYFATRHADNYYAEPGLYIPTDDLRTVQQYEHLVLHAYPLGFGMTVKWSSTKDVKFSQPDAYSLIAETASAGDFEYRAACLDADGKELASKSVQFQISGVDQAEEPLICNQPYLLRLNGTESHTMMLHFTAEHDGEYYIFSESSFAYVKYQREGEAVVDQNSDGLSPWWLEPVMLQKDETITVFVNGFFNDKSVVVSVRDSQPAASIAEAPFQIKNRVFPADQEITAEDIGLTLGELEFGKDYQIMVDSSGTCVHVCGIGKYSGSLSAPLYLYEKMPEVTPVELVFDGFGANTYRIVPEKSGTISFALDVTDAFFDELKDDLTLTRTLDSMYMEINLCDEKWNELSAVNRRFDNLPAAEFEVTANNVYYLQLTHYTDEYLPIVLHSTTGSFTRCISFGYTVEQNHSRYQFQPYDPEINTYLNGKLLKEGTDYDLLITDNELPSQMRIVVRGKGQYFGMFSESIQMELSPEDMPDAAEIRLGDSFMQTEQLGIYKFQLKDWEIVTLSADADILWKAAILHSDLDAETEWDYCPHIDNFKENDEETYLQPGTFYLLIWNLTDTPATFTLSRARSMNIEKMEISAEPLVYTGEVLTPKLTVSMGNTVLQENVDYRIAQHAPIIECGSYQLWVDGIGKYEGFTTVTVNVEPDPERECPLMTEGEVNAEISEAGAVQVYRWIPEHSHYCIAKDFLENAEITVTDQHGDNLCEITGVGYQYAELTVQLRSLYFVNVRYFDTQMTGSIPFRVIPNGKLLDRCMISAPEMLPDDSLDGPPAFEVYDGEQLLTADQDYEVYWQGVEGEYGFGKAVLHGIGQYAGTLEYRYIVYPSLETVLEMGVYEELCTECELSLDWFLPGYWRRFTFTAPYDSFYYLNMPNSAKSGASTVIYMPDGSILPQDVRGLKLSEGETLNILCMSDSLEPETEISTYSLMISVEPVDELYSENGYTYQLEWDIMYLIGIPEGLQGIYVPDFVTDEKNNITGSFFGIESLELKNYIEENCTVYCEKDSAVSRYCIDQGICFAYVDAECTVMGDVTGDGVADRNDMLTLMRWLTEGEGMRMSESACKTGDLDGDGVLTMNDLSLLCRMI